MESEHFEQKGPVEIVEELIVREREARIREAWETLRKQRLELPQQVKIVLERARRAGIKSFKAYFLPEIGLEEGADYPDWTVKPRHWYWDRIEGELNLSGIWVLIDTTPKPNYPEVYGNDPFGIILTALRKSKRFGAPRHIPLNSRFNISGEELGRWVFPAIAKTLGVDDLRVRLPKAIEFNVIGNLFHPEWGKTNTGERFADEYSDYWGNTNSLFGGRSDHGGLGDVDRFAFGARDDHIGFRPLIDLSSEI